MDEKLFKILKKTYCKKKRVKDKNGNIRPVDTGDMWDVNTKTWTYSTDILSETEKNYLISSAYPLNEVVSYSHDECINAYKELLNHPNLTMDNLIAAYVCGFSSFPRGRQPILSYLFAKAVPEHVFSEYSGYDHCEICSIQRQTWIHRGNEIFKKYWGYAWTEFWEKYIVELQEFSELPLCVPTNKDIQIFNELILQIGNALPGERPGKMEERIRKSKIIPGYEKYRFRGQLMVLAELGVLPNLYIKPLYDGFTTFRQRCEIGDGFDNSKSDIILPLSGWRGDHALDEDRLQLLFGRYML